MTNEVILTAKGYKALEQRLEELKMFKRGEVAEKIKIAREFGDISENAEYDAAKDEQAMIEGEILEIEQKLKMAVVISDDAVNSDKVVLGSTVVLHDYEFDEDVTYTIVGTSEADPKKSLISNESPMGEGLLGKKKGDIVEINAPAGIIKVKIISIK
jgi:transcription elongation factor greA